jgi:predicted transcriptional regulator
VGDGIFEEAARARFGLDSSQDVLLRVFCTAQAGKVVGITQKDLAARTGIQQAEISKIERGEVVPKLTTMDRLLAPLGRHLAVVPDENKAA